jgi:hypothetical protein
VGEDATGTFTTNRPARRSRNRREFEQKAAKEAKWFSAGRKTSGFATFAAFCSKASREDKKLPDRSTKFAKPNPPSLRALRVLRGAIPRPL